ncbi:MAG: hypothetical protein QY321_02700 [Patescibacteria group bacterium]|nr:MAG: hypothetical protein QY321_02700 [Patescibacteria group bacterium]
MSYKLAQLTVNPHKKSSVVSKIFVSQPSAEEEQLVGRLFVLMEIDAAKSDEFALADFVVREIYQKYYENEKFFLRDKVSSLKIDYIFEAALTKLNAAIAQFLENEKINVPSGSVTIVIGVIHKNRLLFAQTGQARAMLVYRPISKTGQKLDYSLIDITEKTEDPTQEIGNPNKMFANVINGVVPNRGYFVFTNESVLEYLSKKQLTEVVTTLPPASAVEHIKNLLEQTNAFVPFFGLVIKNTVGEENLATPIATYQVPASKAGGNASLENLNATQESTERLLSPSGFITLKQWLNKLKPASSGLTKMAKGTARQFNVATDKLRTESKKLGLSKRLSATLSLIFSSLVAGLLALLRIFKDKEIRQALFNKIKNFFIRIPKYLAGLIGLLMNMSLKYKIILAIGLVCLVTFSISLINANNQKRLEAAMARVEEINANFDQKAAQLEASRLYNNHEGGKKILDEMLTMINEMPENSDFEKEAKQKLNERHQAITDSLFNTVRIEQPEVYLELGKEAQGIVSRQGTMHILLGQMNIIAQATNGTIEEKTYETIANRSLKSAGAIGNRLYLYSDNEIFSYLPGDQTLQTINLEPKPSNIAAASAYNNRLYLVDQTANQIYRYDQNALTNNFGSRIAWLREPTDLANTNSMGINGQIFVANQTQVKRFSTGTAQTSALVSISPPLEAPDKVLIPEDSSMIYILEKKHQRILVYNDNGQHISSYVSPAFTSASDISVDESRREIYVLVGQTIYLIKAQHLAE